MLQVWDGYDHYTAKTDMLARSGFLQYQEGTTNEDTFSFVTGRDGNGLALHILSNDSASALSHLNYVFSQRVASAYVGFAAYIYPDSGMVVQFYDSLNTGSSQISVQFNPINYSVIIRRGGNGSTGGTIIATSANNVWTANTYNFIEIWPVIDNATGSVNVYIKGNNVLSFSGDTQQSVNAWWDMMVLGGYTAGLGNFSTLEIDDFYYGDTTTPAGTYPFVAPVGDSHTETLFAIGNNSVQWTPLAFTNWEEISEVRMDGDVSYNFSDTVGQEDTFNYHALIPTITSILGVQITGAYRKDDSGVREIKQTIISSATQVYGVNHSLSDVAYTYFTDAWTLDPATAVLWTISAVNAIMAGYNVAV